MGVLAAGRYSDRSRPVIVDVAELVGDLLEMVRSEGGVELQDVVMGRGDCPLAHGLGDEEEVEEFVPGYARVHDGSWSGVGKAGPLLQEESLLDPLRHHREDQFRRCVESGDSTFNVP